MADDMSKNSAIDAPGKSLFFELEFFAVSGRSFLYEAAKCVLAKHDVKLTLPLFAEYFSGKSPELALTRMAADFENGTLGEPELLEELKNVYSASIRNDSAVSDVLLQLIADLRGHGVKLGAITCLDRESSDAVLAKLKLSADDMRVVNIERCGRIAPSAQDWLNLAKEMRQPTTLCTVIATSSSSCKAALCAGMRCVAVPDRLTAFHDFSGADYVVESLEDEAKELVSKLVEEF